MRLSALEAILNRNIAASSAARATCRRLDGKTLAVNFSPAPGSTLLSLYFRCNDECMTVATDNDGPCDAELFGTPFSYLGMIGRTSESAVRSGAIRIEGDAETAQAFRDLLQAAQPEFEEELSRVAGDAAAHRVGTMVRGLLNFGRRVGDTFAQNAAEYLQEESRDLVARIEVDEFNEAVDALRDDVERMQARLDRLQRSKNLP